MKKHNGFASIILIVVIFVGIVVLFAPIPHYIASNEFTCLSLDCPKQGIYWRPSLYNRLINPSETSIDKSNINNTMNENTETDNWNELTVENLGIKFEYPEYLTLQNTNNNSITLSHSIPYQNYGECDMEGGTTLNPKLDDFRLRFEIAEGEQTSIYYDGTYSAGNLEGKWFYEGAEGCGDIVYYFATPDGNTLVIRRAAVQALSGISTMWNKEEILQVDGVISPEKSDELFQQILSSFEFIENE